MKVSFVGTAGIPASYGGFETLVENICRQNEISGREFDFTVWCTSRNANVLPDTFLSARLEYLPISANGPASIVYDIVSIIRAVLNKSDVIVLLGVSGAICLPFVRLFCKAHFITNIDGLEWKRAKWGKFAKSFLRFSEFVAVKFSSMVIADNEVIRRYVYERYQVEPEVIAYGGDNALSGAFVDSFLQTLPEDFFLGLCRIEPENNVEMILNAFSSTGFNLLFVGNWSASEYGRDLYARYSAFENLTLFDAIYDQDILFSLRSRARGYVHGHSAGGTNPSLVEMMHFGCHIIAFDCDFNRATTFDQAEFFGSARNLADSLSRFNSGDTVHNGSVLKLLALDHYRWSVIAERYFDSFRRLAIF